MCDLLEKILQDKFDNSELTNTTGKKYGQWEKPKNYMHF